MASLHKNNASTTLGTTTLTAAATTLTVATGDGALFPNPTGTEFFWLTLDDGTDVEIVKCTTRATDVLTVERGMQGTTATGFASGDTVELRTTAADFEDAGWYTECTGWTTSDYYEAANGTCQGGTSMTAIVLARIEGGQGNTGGAIFNTYRDFIGGGWDVRQESARFTHAITDGGGAKLLNFTNADFGDSGGAKDFEGGALVHIAMTYDGNTGSLYINGNLVDTNSAATTGFTTESATGVAFGIVSYNKTTPFQGGIIGAAYRGNGVLTAATIFDHFLDCIDELDIVTEGYGFQNAWSFKGETSAPSTLSDLIGSADMTKTGTALEVKRRRFSRFVSCGG